MVPTPEEPPPSDDDETLDGVDPYANSVDTTQGDLEEWLRTAAATGKHIFLGQVDDQSVPVGQATNIIPSSSIRKLLLDPELKWDPKGLQIRGARISGCLDLDHTNLRCSLAFEECYFDEAPTFIEADLPSLSFCKVHLPGIILWGSRLTGSCEIDESTVTGSVSAQNARVGGQFVCSSSCVDPSQNPAGPERQPYALSLDGAQTGDVFLSGLRAEGTVRLINLQANGQLDMRGAQLQHVADEEDKEVALSLDGAILRKGAFLDDIIVRGEIHALGAEVVGPFSLPNAILYNPGGLAILLDGANVRYGIHAPKMRVIGAVRAHNVTVDGDVRLTASRLVNLTGPTLDFKSAHISGDFWLQEIEAVGSILFIGGSLRGRLILQAARVSTSSGSAVDLTRSTIESVVLRGTNTLDDGINFSVAKIGVLAVSTMQALPPLRSARDWSLQSVEGILRTDIRTTRRWLDSVLVVGEDTGAGFISQPWKEMAKFFDRIGQPEDARRLRVAAAQRTTKASARRTKPLRWLYGAVVGYGYHPYRTIAWLAALWFVALALGATSPQAFTPVDARATVIKASGDMEADIEVTGATEAPVAYPRFDPALFALDTALPTATTGQATAWRITGSTPLLVTFSAIKGAAWILTALLLAGITGLLRKD